MTIDRWLSEGYYVLCYKEIYEYEVDGKIYEDIEHEFIASFETYEEAEAELPLLGDYYIACP